MNNMQKHDQSSPKVWDELFSSRDLSYSEKADTQGKLFELVKVQFLEKLISKKSSLVRRPLSRLKSLEVGCGTAFVSLYFAKRGFEVTCLDSSKQILKVAKNNFRKEGVQGKYIVGDAGKLPFKDDSFDIIMSFGLLEHFSDPGPAVAEMVRVLRPGGLFFADIVPKRFSVQSLGSLFNALVVLGYWGARGDWKKGIKKARANFHPEYYENSLSWQEYKKMITDCGLVNVEVRGNRPFPRLTLPKSLDTLYTLSLKLLVFPWSLFDRYGGVFARWWGAGWWFWAFKV